MSQQHRVYVTAFCPVKQHPGKEVSAALCHPSYNVGGKPMKTANAMLSHSGPQLQMGSLEPRKMFYNKFCKSGKEGGQMGDEGGGG